MDFLNLNQTDWQQIAISAGIVIPPRQDLYVKLESGGFGAKSPGS